MLWEEQFCGLWENDSAAHGFWLVCFFVLLFHTEWKIADIGNLTLNRFYNEKRAERNSLGSGSYFAVIGKITLMAGRYAVGRAVLRIVGK